MRQLRGFYLLIIFFSRYPSIGQKVIEGPAGISFIKIYSGHFLYGKYSPPYPVADTTNNNGYTDAQFASAKKLALQDALSGFVVTIPSDFFLGKTEVTQRQWKMVMNNNPSAFKDDDQPVENVSWKDVQEFLVKINSLDTLHHYRLPTEFEWEYAARAGARDDISWDEIRLQAQMGSKSPAKVGTKKPNPWGLYDMLGNVWEWTQDIYNEKLFAEKVPLTIGNTYVLKGASFTGDVKNATYMTHAGGPGNGWDVGFRVLMEDKKSQPLRDTQSKKSVSPVTGWHVSRTSHQGTTPGITSKNGVITLKQHPYGQGGVLLTDKKYKDFEITLEAKIDSFCNGGIFLRSSESGQAYQIELAEPGGTGNLFGEMMRISKPGIAEKRSGVWKAGGWNEFRIRMTGKVPRIMLWINGELMYDITEPENDFTADAIEGMIGLQAHWSVTYSAASKAFDMSSSWRPGGKQQFRKIRIKEL